MPARQVTATYPALCFYKKFVVLITGHAIDRFLERCPSASNKSAADALRILSKLLSKAVPEKIPVGKEVKRLINNDFREVKYVRHGNLRFVLRDDDRTPDALILVTVEPNTYDRTGRPNYTLNRRGLHGRRISRK